MDGHAPAKAAGSLARSMAHHVSMLGMKLDWDDKDFVLVSDEGPLQAAERSMIFLAGSAVHAVRKLGMDYAAFKRGKKMQNVGNFCSQRGTLRWKRLCKMAFKNQGTVRRHAATYDPLELHCMLRRRGRCAQYTACWAVVLV